MSSELVGGIGCLSLLILLALRVPIGVGLLAVSMIGIYLLRGMRPMLGMLETVPFGFATTWTLSAIPMFLLMGSLAGAAGTTSGLYSAMRLWLGWLPGGLAVATTFAGAGFAAASGSSLATTATMGRMAVPEMLKLGYDPGLATGSASAVGTLGALIPPSIIIVLYAVFAGLPVGMMLIAGIVPGLLTAAAYAGLIILRCALKPALAPSIDLADITWKDRFGSLLRTWPLPVLAICIIGGIYSGFVTATEAGALGALLAGIVGVASGQLRTRKIVRAIDEALRTTAMVLFIAVGAVLFARFMALSGMPTYVAQFVAAESGSPMLFVLLVCVLILVMGCFIDTIGIMLLTLPVFLPIFHSMNLDPIWMGVIIVKMLEIGLLTPPLGMNVFVMKGVVGDAVSLTTIFKGVTWMLLAEAVVMALLIAFPVLSTGLPSIMQ